MLEVFVPAPSSPAVRMIEHRVRQTDVAISVSCRPNRSARPRHCFENVLAAVAAEGGEMVPGWLVWQHGDIFIEAEHHAVWRKPDGELRCITPQQPQEQQVTFVPDPLAVWDSEKRLMTHNIRVALIPDSRLEQVFRASDRQTDIINATPHQQEGSDEVVLSAADSAEYRRLEMQRSVLMAKIIQSKRMREQPSPPVFPKVGRNEPCPCGSGVKYKKCHGASV